MTRLSRRITLGVATLAAGILLCCSSPEKELRKAREAGTTEALDAFLAKHPDGPLAEQARDAMAMHKTRAVRLMTLPLLPVVPLVRQHAHGNAASH